MTPLDLHAIDAKLRIRRPLTVTESRELLDYARLLQGALALAEAARNDAIAHLPKAGDKLGHLNVVS